MHHLRRALERLFHSIRRHRAETDLAREIDAHVGLLEDEYRRRGLPPDEAHRRARIALGGIEHTKERHRDARSFRWLTDVRRDVGYAARLLGRNPVFAATAVLSLAVGIGASTTVFTAANTLLLRTAPGIAGPERLVDITRSAGVVGVEPIPLSQYLAIRDRATLVEGVYAYDLKLSALSLTGLPGQTFAEPVYGSVVTGNYFTTLGVLPAAGRMFTDTDVHPVVTLSHRFWRRRFAGDPGIVGRTLKLNDRAYTVLGVASESFHGNTVLAPDVWLRTDASRPLDLGLVGARLKPGVRLSQAAAEIAAIARRDDASNTSETLTVSRSSPIPVGVRLLVAGFLTLLMAIVALVLAIACANVAGVLLARATARRREIAVRLALGVGRARLVRQLLTETVLLFALGGIAGLILSRVMNAAILRVLPSFSLPAELALTQDARVLGFSMAVSFVTAVLFGLTPAIEASKVDVVSILKADEHGPAAASRLRRAFVVTEVALSVVLVIAGGLLSRALGRAGSASGGYDPTGVEIAAIDLSLAGYTNDSGPAFAGDLLARIRAVPGIAAAALAYAPPGGGAIGFQISVPDTATDDGRPFVTSLGNVVSPGYFSAMRIPLAAGREFLDTDAGRRERVAVISEAAVRRFLPGVSSHDAVGRHVLLQSMLIERATRQLPPPTPITVVGVARDLIGVNGATPRPFIYLPIQQQYTRALTVIARSADGHRIANQLRSVISGTDPRLPVLRTAALEDEAGPVMTQLRITAAVAATLGVVGCLLAAVGIYGLTAFVIARRTREIGVRVALGAERADVVRFVLAEGMRLVALGSAAGLLVAAGVTRLLTHLLFGVAPLDPLTFGGTAVLFALVGLAACYVPLRRALAINPVEALRYE